MRGECLIGRGETHTEREQEIEMRGVVKRKSRQRIRDTNENTRRI